MLPRQAVGKQAGQVQADFQPVHALSGAGRKADEQACAHHHQGGGEAAVFQQQQGEDPQPDADHQSHRDRTDVLKVQKRLGRPAKGLELALPPASV